MIPEAYDIIDRDTKHKINPIRPILPYNYRTDKRTKFVELLTHYESYTKDMILLVIININIILIIVIIIKHLVHFLRRSSH